tara:strand:- start:1116 stop:1385 length:270 start_codon:yes stop_codon:yes gene_type:complete
MDDDDKVFGRVMRLPGFDGMIPERGPIHLVSDDGEEYLLIAALPDTPGDVETLALECEGRFATYIGKDLHMSGKILGSILWHAKLFECK